MNCQDYNSCLKCCQLNFEIPSPMYRIVFKYFVIFHKSNKTHCYMLKCLKLPFVVIYKVDFTKRGI